MARTAGLLILLGILCLPREPSFLFAGRGRRLQIGRPHSVLRAGPSIGMAFSATVKKLEKNGAVVDLPKQKPGWIHISELQEGYTQKVEDVLSVGQKIDVRILKVKPHELEVRELRNESKTTTHVQFRMLQGSNRWVHSWVENTSNRDT